MPENPENKIKANGCDFLIEHFFIDFTVSAALMWLNQRKLFAQLDFRGI